MSNNNFPFSSKKEEARNIIQRRVFWASLIAGLTGPLPFTSVALTGMEAKLTYDIARVYGYAPTLQEAAATIGALIATSGVLKTVAIESATTFPVIGWWLIKPGIAASTVKGVGELAIGHYEQKRKSDNT